MKRFWKPSAALGISFAGALALAVSLTPGCGGSDNNNGGGGGGDGGSGDDGGISFGDGCTGIRCAQVMCSGGGHTTVSGVVYDPAGKTPLYNAIVYVPNDPPKPFDKGASCDKCGFLTGSPITTTLSDTHGHFTLQDVPATKNVPLVIQIGKWRRQITIPNVPQCTDTQLPADQTRLPKNRMEGDLPQMALVTGGLDPLECLLRKIGIDDNEFTGPLKDGAVHMYQGVGGAVITDSQDATGLYRDEPTIAQHDIVLLACEGGTHPENKPASALQAMYDYASKGGRIFATHYHYYWLENGPAPFPTTATWSHDPNASEDLNATIDTSFPKGMAFSDWLVNVGASTTAGQLPIKQARNDVSAVNGMVAQRWIYDNTPQPVLYYSFNTPLTVPDDQKCGRIVFSDVHVSSGDNPGSLAFPAGCITTDLSPQEKALEFLLFDLSSCIQTDNTPPEPPR